MFDIIIEKEEENRKKQRESKDVGNGWWQFYELKYNTIFWNFEKVILDIFWP